MSTCMLQQTSSPLAVAAPSMDSRYILARIYAMPCHMESHVKRQEYLAVKCTALLSVIMALLDLRLVCMSSFVWCRLRAALGV